MSKQQLQSVLSIARSGRERGCIRYTAIVASGLSATSARKRFEGVSEKVQGVENVIQEIEEIQSAYESIANVQEKATLAQFGIEYKDDSESSTGSSETDSDVDSADVELPPESIANFPLEKMLAVLKTRQCNWLELVSMVDEMGIDPNCLESYYELVSSHFSEHELCLLQQSHAAYLHSE